jgi:hypothetical protein
MGRSLVRLAKGIASALGPDVRVSFIGRCEDEALRRRVYREAMTVFATAKSPGAKVG